MTYAETKIAIDKIRNRNEMLFRMAFSHLMDVGIRHLTEENVMETCTEIMQQDDSKAFMTNEYMCDIVRTAYELAQFDHIYLLNYFGKEVYYDVGDNAIDYKRAMQIIRNCLCYVADGYGAYSLNCEETLNNFREMELTDEEIEYFGWGVFI